MSSNNDYHHHHILPHPAADRPPLRPTRDRPPSRPFNLTIGHATSDQTQPPPRTHTLHSFWEDEARAADHEALPATQPPPSPSNVAVHGRPTQAQAHPPPPRLRSRWEQEAEAEAEAEAQAAHRQRALVLTAGHRASDHQQPARGGPSSYDEAARAVPLSGLGGARPIEPAGPADLYGEACDICFERWAAVPVEGAAGGAGCCGRPSKLPCGHVFGRGCLEEWLRRGHRSCPMCRRGVWPVWQGEGGRAEEEEVIREARERLPMFGLGWLRRAYGVEGVRGWGARDQGDSGQGDLGEDEYEEISGDEEERFEEEEEEEDFMPLANFERRDFSFS